MTMHSNIVELRFSEYDPLCDALLIFCDEQGIVYQDRPVPSAQQDASKPPPEVYHYLAYPSWEQFLDFYNRIVRSRFPQVPEFLDCHIQPWLTLDQLKIAVFSHVQTVAQIAAEDIPHA